MNVRALSHRGDPATSREAATLLGDTLRLKRALVELLADAPLPADEITTVYFQVAEFRRWPSYEDRHNVKRRLSELHRRHHVIRESGERRPSRLGRAATVWELAVPVGEAHRILEGS